MVDEYQDTNHAQYRLVPSWPRSTRTWRGRRHDQSIYASGAPTSATSSSSSRTSPTPRRSAGAELPLHPDDPGRRQRRDRATTATASPSGCGRTSARGRHGAGGRGRGRARRGPVRGRAHPAALDDGASAREIAVFYRINAQSRVLEDLLTRQRHRVPGRGRAASSTSGPRSRTRSPTCRCSINPDDEVSLRRISTSRARGIGATSLDRLSSHAATLGDLAVGGDPRTSRHLPLAPRRRRNLLRFRELIERAARGSGRGLGRRRGRARAR